MATTNLSNDRVFYATQAVAIAPRGTAPDVYEKIHAAHGVQSIGITTNFNLEQVFELGQLEIYENVEGIPDVEVTMEKVITDIRFFTTWRPKALALLKMKLLHLMLQASSCLDRRKDVT